MADWCYKCRNCRLNMLPRVWGKEIGVQNRLLTGCGKEFCAQNLLPIVCGKEFCAQDLLSIVCGKEFCVQNDLARRHHGLDPPPPSEAPHRGGPNPHPYIALTHDVVPKAKGEAQLAHFGISTPAFSA